MRGEGSFAYWAVSPGAAQDLARRLYLDRRLRRQLADDALGMTVEELDARATEALRSTEVDLGHGDDGVARLFVSGDA